jgi:hypothetical protein
VSLTESNAIFVLDKYISLLEPYFIWDLDQMKFNKFLQYKISDFTGKSRLIGDEDFIDSTKSLHNKEIMDGNLYGKFKDITQQMNENFIFHELENDYKGGTTHYIKHPSENFSIYLLSDNDHKKGSLLKIFF